jgi:hypothetical protein
MLNAVRKGNLKTGANHTPEYQAFEQILDNTQYAEQSCRNN